MRTFCFSKKNWIVCDIYNGGTGSKAIWIRKDHHWFWWFSYISVRSNLFENINFPDLLHKWIGFSMQWMRLFTEKNFHGCELSYLHHHFKFNGSMFKDSWMLFRIAFLRVFRIHSRYTVIRRCILLLLGVYCILYLLEC